MTAKPRLVIANMYRAKNKSAFFAIHQAITKLSEFEIEFHILWDDEDYTDEWSAKIQDLNANIVDYTKSQLDQYCLDYGVDQSKIDSFAKFKAIYFILHGHYLKKNNITNYYLIYDDDIILGDELFELKYCLVNELPCLLHEPLNSNCDKALANTIFQIYEGAWEYYKQINPHLLGFNAGIQGIRLDMYDDFLDPEYFLFMLNLFNYRGIYDENGKELVGPERSVIDTQQQSFFGVMNIIKSKKAPHIMTPDQYFVCPNWGYHPLFGEINPESELGGWDVSLKSKVVHFIGHTVLEGVNYGKPQTYHNLVNEYLIKHNII
jgi:hypothetical protein